MSIGQQLAQLRASKGVPASAIQRSSGIDVSNLYAIERDRRDAHGSTLESIARSLGAQVLVLDTDNRGTVHEASVEIGEALSNDDNHAAAQVLIQVFSNLHALDELPTLALVQDQPVDLDPRWGSALAGIVDLALSSRGLPTPRWLRVPAAALPSPWDPWTGGTVLPDAEDVPEQLLARGVWIEESELRSA